MFFPLPTWITFMCPSHSTLYTAFQGKRYWKPKLWILLLFLQCFISMPCLHHPQLSIIQQLWKPLQGQPIETWGVQSSLSSPCWKTTHKNRVLTCSCNRGRYMQRTTIYLWFPFLSFCDLNSDQSSNKTIYPVNKQKKLYLNTLCSIKQYLDLSLSTQNYLRTFYI